MKWQDSCQIGATQQVVRSHEGGRRNMPLLCSDWDDVYDDAEVQMLVVEA